MQNFISILKILSSERERERERERYARWYVCYFFSPFWVYLPNLSAHLLGDVTPATCDTQVQSRGTCFYSWLKVTCRIMCRRNIRRLYTFTRLNRMWMGFCSLRNNKERNGWVKFYFCDMSRDDDCSRGTTLCWLPRSGCWQELHSCAPSWKHTNLILLHGFVCHLWLFYTGTILFRDVNWPSALYADVMETYHWDPNLKSGPFQLLVAGKMYI